MTTKKKPGPKGSGNASKEDGLAPFMRPIPNTKKMRKPDKVFAAALLRILSSNPDRLRPLVDDQSQQNADRVAFYLRFIASRIEDGKWHRGEKFTFLERQQLIAAARHVDERRGRGETITAALDDEAAILAKLWSKENARELVREQIVAVRKRRAALRRASSGK